VDGFAAAVSFLGGRAVEYDTLNDPEVQNLLDEQVWAELRASILAGKYAGALMGPPCSTFSAARSLPGGPRPLRGAEGQDLYGLQGLAPKEQEQVKSGTLLALRAFSVAALLTQQGAPWIIENPAWREGHPHMFRLAEAAPLRKSGARDYELVQRTLGADSEKRTALLTNLQLYHWADECPHPPRDWRRPWSGKTLRCPHAPLRGRQRAMLADLWEPSLLRDKEPSSPFCVHGSSCIP